jgi:hypothetical protein
MDDEDEDMDDEDEDMDDEDEDMDDEDEPVSEAPSSNTTGVLNSPLISMKSEDYYCMAEVLKSLLEKDGYNSFFVSRVDEAMKNKFSSTYSTLTADQFYQELSKEVFVDLPSFKKAFSSCFS